MDRQPKRCPECETAMKLDYNEDGQWLSCPKCRYAHYLDHADVLDYASSLETRLAEAEGDARVGRALRTLVERWHEQIAKNDNPAELRRRAKFVLLDLERLIEQARGGEQRG